MRTQIPTAEMAEGNSYCILKNSLQNKFDSENLRNKKEKYEPQTQNWKGKPIDPLKT